MMFTQVRSDLPDSERMSAEARELARELKAVCVDTWKCGVCVPESHFHIQTLRQVRRERDVLQSRLEAAEAEAERERGLHRRELRRKAKEAQEVWARWSGSVGKSVVCCYSLGGLSWRSSYN